MNIHEFIGKYRNHPVLFIGTGFSLRYLNNSFTWDNLLKQVSYNLKENNEYYLDIKSKCESDGKYDYTKIASLLESEFNETLLKNRNGKFKDVNDKFYSEMDKGNNLSRLKIYLSQLLNELDYKENIEDEIIES